MSDERTHSIHSIRSRVRSRTYVDILEKKNRSSQRELNPNSSSSWPSYYTYRSKSNSHFSKWLLALQVPHLMSNFCSLHHSSPTPCVSFYNMKCFLHWNAAGPLHKSECQRTLSQLSVTTYSKYSPVTNTCVHKSVSSHISLCTPCVYVLARILRMFLGIGGYNSVRHGMGSDIGTAVLLRTDPKLDRPQARS